MDQLALRGGAAILCARCTRPLKVTRRDQWTRAGGKGPTLTTRMDIEPCAACEAATEKKRLDDCRSCSGFIPNA